MELSQVVDADVNTISQEKTRKFVLCDPKDSNNSILNIISKTTECIDFCFEDINLILTEQIEDNNAQSVLWIGIIGLRNKGIKYRFIAEITKENLFHCKKLIKIGELRHIDGLKGNFGVCDRNIYLGYLKNKGDNQQEEKVLVNSTNDKSFVLSSDNKSFVDMQQFLFDRLWNNAVPVKARIIEIQRNQVTDHSETLKEPEEIQILAFRLLKSAVYDIFIIFPTIMSCHWAEDKKVLDLLKEAIEERGVNVKVLVYAESEQRSNDSNDNRETIQSIQRKLKEKHLQESVNFVHRELHTKDISFIVDQAVSLSVEIDPCARGKVRILSATISNSESAVSFFVSMFENLWIQSEFEKQSKIKKVYFQVFKGLRLKDETYKRQWSSEAKSTANSDND
jgi:two-component system sensor histidine kinase VicK